MSIIEVNHLTKDYGSGRGVFDVSFKIEKGEVFGFLGPNGAGKSTTIRHLMGFSHPGLGNTKILGMDSFKDYDRILNKVGYIPGEIALPQGLTGYQFIDMMQHMYHVNNKEMLDKMLNLFELKENELIMSDPEVLILDEPTSGLDPIMQQRFIDFVIEEKKRGKTILLSSHIFSEVDATCDRIAIIKDGRIVDEFISNDLKHASLKQYRIRFNDLNNYEKFINEYDKNIINILKEDKEKLILNITCEDENINKVINLFTKYNIKEFNNIKETLEDYFMHFYKEDKEFGGNF